MFTGIVETLGTVVSCGAGKLVVAPGRPFQRIKIGESICVDGVCLTVDRLNGKKITFRLLPETVRVSTLGTLRRGDRVNLERSLKLGDRLGGHLLLGHVDGQGKVVGRSRAGKTLTLEVEIPPSLALGLVPKGPIGVDGVSLTLDPTIKRNRIQVHLIPHTAAVTTLGSKSVGSRVNLEADLILKYLRGML